MKLCYIKPKKRIGRLEARQNAYERQSAPYKAACRKPGSMSE